MPKISIIVPVYNVGQYLRECLESIIRQTFQDIEIICVNDGSTDNSLDILKEYEQRDKRIKVINKQNSGYGNTMNIGLKQAQGDYIGIIESDDRAVSEMFAELYNVAIKFDADVVKSNYFNLYGGNTVEYKENLEELPYHVILDAEAYPELYGIDPSIWSGLYRRSFLEKNDILFHETPGASYQDVSFAFAIWFYAKKVVCIKGAFLEYRTDNENSSVKSLDKVSCIFDEYHWIDKIMAKDWSKEKIVAPQLSIVKYRRYMWNYRRVASFYQHEFITSVSKEYNLEYQKGRLEQTYWTEGEWEEIQRIIQEPDVYYRDTNEEYINKYRLEKYTINNTLYLDAYMKGFIKFLSESEKVIIYGAGNYGRKMAEKVKKHREVFAFAVTSKTDNLDTVQNIPVIEISELQEYKQCAFVIVAVKKTLQPEIVSQLFLRGFEKIFTVDREFLDQTS